MTTHHATTLQDTRHGHPSGPQVTIPAGARVIVKPADNMPHDCPIKYWLVSWACRPIDSRERNLRALLGATGIGFHAEDIRLNSQ